MQEPSAKRERLIFRACSNPKPSSVPARRIRSEPARSAIRMRAQRGFISGSSYSVCTSSVKSV
eukprot:gene7579-gene6002